MKFTQATYIITSKKEIADSIYDFTVKCDDIAKVAKPGQFVHVKIEGFSLRRPISIASIDSENGTIRIVFEVRGDGTLALSKLNEGDEIDIIGPLGNGSFKLLGSGKKAICVGGGIGVPPMLALAEYYKSDATAICGFRNAGHIILKEDFEECGANTVICTDDGSAGRKGFVTDALLESIAISKPDIIYACGPKAMLKAIVNIANENNIECQVSLEERMGCGVGACLVCACRTVKDGNEFMSHVCKDGPVFDSKEVIL